MKFLSAAAESAMSASNLEPEQLNPRPKAPTDESPDGNE
jgi:hypothetical protein